MFPPELISFFRASTHIAVLTGAGVSQESGLRTFRDAQDGFWAQYRPEDLATPQAFARNPNLVWEWYALRRRQAAEVQPNPGHFALAEIARLVPNFTLITQNVDGLHQRAGNPDVIELHGNISRVRCSVCGQFPADWLDDPKIAPPCPSCCGLLRPDVVWFGESLPAEGLSSAVNAAKSCQVFFSIGTSGLVEPAASLAYAVRQRGAVLVEVNKDPTPLTPHCDFSFHGKSGEILPQLVRSVC